MQEKLENEFTLLSTVIHLVAQGFLQQFLFYANGLLSLFELIDPLFDKYLLIISYLGLWEGKIFGQKSTNRMNWQCVKKCQNLTFKMNLLSQESYKS